MTQLENPARALFKLDVAEHGCTLKEAFERIHASGRIFARDGGTAAGYRCALNLNPVRWTWKLDRSCQRVEHKQFSLGSVSIHVYHTRYFNAAGQQTDTETETCITANEDNEDGFENRILVHTDTQSVHIY